MFNFIWLVTILSNLLFLLIHAGLVNFKLKELDASPNQIVWCGLTGNVIISTQSNSVYFSNNNGLTFSLLNQKFLETGEEVANAYNTTDIGKVAKIIQSPIDSNLLIFLGTHGINWVGEDCGKKVKALNHGRKLLEFVFHPTEREWGLASAFTLCEDFSNGEPCKIYKEILVTKDLGENWDIVGSYVVQFGWGVFDESHIKNGYIPKERILMTLDPRGKGHQTEHKWSYKIDFMYSDDFFRTKKIGVLKGNKFILTRNYIFVAQVLDENAGEVTLQSAKSIEKVYMFHPIETTSRRLLDHSFSFLETSGHSIFIHMNHFGDSSKWGHVYTSDYMGTRYSLSLKYNIRTSENQCDFQKVLSLNGVYIANIVDNEFMKNEEEEFEKELFEAEMAMQERPRSKSMSQGMEFKNYIETRITFNNGGIWRRLMPPLRGHDGKKWNCEGECYLNLHADFYSVESAAGILIGNGNVGKYLLHDPSSISTFLSRDAGFTWFEVKNGRHIYEIGDHGALILIAEEGTLTTAIHYTWDEGLTWQELKISEDPLLIKKIINGPGSISQEFIVFAEYSQKGEKKGIVVSLDFSSLHEPQCRNPEEPNSIHSDYETWSPNDGTEKGQCFMGKKIIYIRRKRDAECFNGQAFEKKRIRSHCPCTEADYECEVGYGRESPLEACVPLQAAGGNDDSPHPLGECMGEFTVSQGYRRIPENECVDDGRFDPIVVRCSSYVFPSIEKLISIIIVCSMIVCLLYLAYRNRNMLLNAIDSMSQKVSIYNPKEKKIDDTNLV